MMHSLIVSADTRAVSSLQSPPGQETRQQCLIMRLIYLTIGKNIFIIYNFCCGRGGDIWWSVSRQHLIWQLCWKIRKSWITITGHGAALSTTFNYLRLQNKKKYRKWKSSSSTFSSFWLWHCLPMFSVSQCLVRTCICISVWTWRPCQVSCGRGQFTRGCQV